MLESSPEEKEFVTQLLFDVEKTPDLADYRSVYISCIGIDPVTNRAVRPDEGANEMYDRHDNDSRDVQCIRLIPTADELRSKRDPLRPKEPTDMRYQSSEHLLDRHFRLLRDEIVSTCLDEICSPRRRVYTKVKIREATVDKSGQIALVVQFQFPQGHKLHQLKTEKERQEFVKNARRMFADQSLIVICSAPVGNEKMSARDSLMQRILTVGTVNCRDDRRTLLQNPPTVTVLCAPTEYWQAQHTGNLEMVGTTVTTFGQLPVLAALQRSRKMPFAHVLLESRAPQTVSVDAGLVRGADAEAYLRDLLDFGRRPPAVPVAPAARALPNQLFDKSQLEAIDSAESRDVTIIQGPPGTGKTHVGVEICKRYLGSSKRILMLCYTNHALDQFLLRVSQKEGVDKSKLARLGAQVKDPDVLEFVRDIGKGSGPQAKRSLAELHQLQEAAVDQLDSMVHDNPLLAALQSDRRLSALILDHGVLKWWQKKIDERSQWLPKIRTNEIAQHQQRGRNNRGDGGRGGRGRDQHNAQHGDQEFMEPHALYLWDVFRSGHGTRGILPRPGDPRRELVTQLLDLTPELRQPLIADVVLRAKNEQRQLSAVRGLEMKLEMLQGQFDRHRADAASEQLVRYSLAACTTSFAAKNLVMLSQQNFDCVVVEEAAEILESHVLMSVPLSAKQLVLIGDHQQLRPSVKSYHLTIPSNRGFNLDRSLFERLVKTKVPFFCLNTQHRMFPALSQVVRRLSYPQLLDSVGVVTAAAKPVPGLTAQLLFVDHNFMQHSCDDDESIGHYNIDEAQFVAQTVRHILLQDVARPCDIVVLTGYLGQVKQLDEALKHCDIKTMLNSQTKLELKRKTVADDDDSDNDDDDEDEEEINREKIRQREELRRQSVRVSSIDNFQGEEADYIIASLVRSDKPGFMKERERVTVLLSRAKKGMILFGNRLVLESAPGGAWKDAFTDLPCSPQLKIMCRSHKRGKSVSSAQELFNASPDGGCHIPCERKMPCDHACPRMCHVNDPGHQLQAKKCTVPVEKYCPAAHYYLVPCNKKNSNPDEVCGTCVDLKKIEREHEKQLKQIQKEQETASRKIQRENAENEKELEVEVERLQGKLVTAQQAFHQRIMAASAAQLLGQRSKESIDQEIKEITASMQAVRDATQRAQSQLAKEEELLQRSFYEKQVQLQAKTDNLKIRKNVEEAELNSHAQRAQAFEAALAKRKLGEAAFKRNEDQMKDLAEQLHRLRQQSSQEALPCCICSGDVPMTQLIVCPSKHIFCGECFGHLVKSHADKELVTRMKVDGLVSCPGCDEKQCTHLFTTRFICLVAPEEVYNYHVRSVNQVKEKQVLDAEAQRRDAEQKRLERDSISQHFSFICEHLINLACPRCKQVFENFNGCTALTCIRCKCGFCAWCFKDCGDDAHKHIAEAHPDQMFTKFHEWTKFQSERRKGEVERYLREKKLPDDVSTALRERIKSFL